VNFFIFFLLYSIFLFILTSSFLLGTILANLTIPGKMMMTPPPRDKVKLGFVIVFMLFLTLLTILFLYSEQYSSDIPIKLKRKKH
jgi:hypothetical protein